jgi:hypothetical protein
VVASHEVTREHREYERGNTTVLSAYVAPIARIYLENLTKSLDEAGMHCLGLRSAGRGSRVFLIPLEHLLTSFHTILIVEFGGHLPTLPSF